MCIAGDEDDDDISMRSMLLVGDHERARTSDLAFRKRLLYPTELRGLYRLRDYSFKIHHRQVRHHLLYQVYAFRLGNA